MANLGVEATLVDFGPHVRAGDVKGGVLPALPLAAEAANVEAVELDQIAGVLGFEVKRDRPRGTLRFRRAGVAGDQRQPLPARVEPVAPQDAVNCRRRHLPATPLRQRHLGRQPSRPQPRFSQREDQDLVLQRGCGLVEHPRQPTLPGPQDLKSFPVDTVLPAVELERW